MGVIDLGESLYPIAIVEDRYQGGYSGGRWFAVARASELYLGSSRIAWVVTHGPSAGDVEAAQFWADQPLWIATGNSPDAAEDALRTKHAKGDVTISSL